MDRAGRRVGSLRRSRPLPSQQLDRLVATASNLTPVREPSLAALERLPRLDAFVIERDHNSFTTSRTRRVEARSSGALSWLGVVDGDVVDCDSP